jgi:hypothetical protein
MNLTLSLIIILLFSLSINTQTSCNNTKKDKPQIPADEKEVSDSVDKFNAQIEEVAHLLSKKSKTKNLAQLSELRVRLHDIKADAASRKIDTLIDVDKILSLESSISAYIAASTSTTNTDTLSKRESRKLRA